MILWLSGKDIFPAEFAPARCNFCFEGRKRKSKKEINILSGYIRGLLLQRPAIPNTAYKIENFFQMATFSDYIKLEPLKPPSRDGNPPSLNTEGVY